MNKNSIIPVLIIVTVIAGGVFVFQKNKVETPVGPVAVVQINQLDLLHTYVPKKLVTRDEVTKAWKKIPADANLNAGNTESPCEGPSYESRALNKVVDGNAYPIFLIDDQLLLGTSSKNSSYAFHENDVWYLGNVGCGKITGAGKNTFRAIGYKNAIDKNYAYFEYKIVDGADIATYGMYKDYGEWWTGDNASVFYKGERISSLAGMHEIGDGWLRTDTKILYNTRTTEVTDPSSFEIIKYAQYQKDKDHVYVLGVILDGADPSTFEKIGSYFRDKARVYYPHPRNEIFKETDPMSDRVVVKNIDGKTFEIIPNGNVYYKDKNNIYRGDGDDLTPFTGVDMKTFEVLGECGCIEKSCGYYSKDNSHVFCGTTLIKDADPRTFTIIGSFGNSGGMPMRETIAKDKNCIYKQELAFLKPDGLCVSPSECATPFIDEKNSKLCGFRVY